jgi:diaminopimelate epimerase
MSASTVRIVKMSGAGNDFVVLDGEQAERLGAGLVPWIRQVCRRGLSVGGDGVLVVEATESGRVRVGFYNPDGTRTFCGNGSRCAARFAHLQGWTPRSFVLETDAGEVPATVSDAAVSLRLPLPSELGSHGIELADGSSLDGSWVRAGVPHFVVFVDSVANAPLANWGPLVRRHHAFGEEGVNLDIAERRDGHLLVVRTWERGVEGETLACGSGAVASAFAAARAGDPGPFDVLPASGVPLRVEFTGDAEPPAAVLFSGDARVVFSAEVDRESVEGFGTS